MTDSPASATERPAHPTFWEAFLYWLKLGFISFGGPRRTDRHHASGAGRKTPLDR